MLPSAKPTKIYGHDVFFPEGKLPFSAQKSVISKALIALNKGQNALLESPTGTGKTLALLTSTLSWQKKNYEQAVDLYAEQLQQVEDNGDVKPEHLEERAGRSSAAASVPASVVRSALPPPKRKQIYFCARTHSQLQQSVDELKNCHDSYLSSLAMCVLSARKHLCVNDTLLTERVGRPGAPSVDEGCRALLTEGEGGCRFNNQHTMQRTGEELDKSGVWDIEDAVWMGRKHKSCPYFVTRKLHQARPALCFAPYSYLLNSSIRGATGVDLRNAIVVFDEAHNVESACREAASCEVFLSALHLLAAQLRQGSQLQGCGCPVSYSALHGLLAPLAQWLARAAQLLEHSDLQRGSDHVWAGPEVLALFAEELQLTPASLAQFLEHLAQVQAAEEEGERQALQDLRQGVGGRAAHVNVQYEEEEEELELELEEQGGEGEGRGAVGGGVLRKKGALSASSLQLLKDLLRVFDYMLREEARYMECYKLVVLKQKRGRDWDVTLNLWCLSASVAFRDFAECHCVILTSGTLSPLDSFSAELGMDFAVRVEAQHVIDTDAQVLAAAVCKFGQVDLKCTFQFHDDVRYQDALGNCLLSVRQASSAGMLVFFPSYGLLDKVTQRWASTGLATALGGSGSGGGGGVVGSEEGSRAGGVLVEPRDGKELAGVLAAYYRRIEAGLPGVLLAVCRGKVSEGIDFADEYARTVCVVGIPFPSLQDLQVRLKREHQDELCKQQQRQQSASASTSLRAEHLAGDKWYSQEAFRAVNQAVGRCIRHVKDFGAIVLLDPRYGLPENQAQMSKWLRGKIKSHEQLGDMLVGLRSFTHSNRLKFGEHLAAWRKRHAAPSPALVSRAGTAGAATPLMPSSSSLTGLSCQQRAVAGMFGKYTGGRALQPAEPADTDKSGGSLPPDHTSRLSAFTLDYFARAPAPAPSSLCLSIADQASREQVLEQAAAWRLGAAGFTREVSSSSRGLFGVEPGLQLRDVTAAKIPGELSYLARHLFRRDRLLMVDPATCSATSTGSDSSSSSSSEQRRMHPLPAGGATYAVSLQCWDWEEKAPPQLPCRWHTRELWVAEDEAAYRLLEYCASPGRGGEDTVVLVAATVVGASRRRMGLVDQAWMSVELLLLLLCPQTNSPDQEEPGVMGPDYDLFSAATQPLEPVSVPSSSPAARHQQQLAAESPAMVLSAATTRISCNIFPRGEDEEDSDDDFLDWGASPNNRSARKKMKTS